MGVSFRRDTHDRLRRSRVRGFGAVLLCLAALVAPTSALASLESPVSIHDIWGSFVGTFSVTSFSSDPTGALFANGTLSGTLYDPLGEVSGTVDNLSVSPRPIFSVAATCQSLEVGLETAGISIEGRLAVWGGTLSVSTTSKTPTLCKVSRLIEKNASSGQIAAALNKYLSKSDP
jgi:hypothetical protein